MEAGAPVAILRGSPLCGEHLRMTAVLVADLSSSRAWPGRTTTN